MRKPYKYRESIDECGRVAHGLKVSARKLRAKARRLREASQSPHLSPSEADRLRREAWSLSRGSRARYRRARAFRAIARVLRSEAEPEAMLARGELRALLASAPGGAK